MNSSFFLLISQNPMVKVRGDFRLSFFFLIIISHSIIPIYLSIDQQTEGNKRKEN